MSDEQGGALPPSTLAIGRRMLLVGALAVAACGRGGGAMPDGQSASGLYVNETPHLRSRINYWSRHYEVPPALVHRVIIRESHHRPGARNGPYYGLMQILPQTARTMGYRGPDHGLLDADANLQFGVKYLRGAYLVADRNHDDAIRWYSRGYYYEAKRKGMLEVTGLRG